MVMVRRERGGGVPVFDAWVGDGEDDANPQEKPPKHGTQLWGQVEAHDLTEERIVVGRVGLKL